jgi:hypothetical protein
MRHRDDYNYLHLLAESRGDVPRKETFTAWQGVALGAATCAAIAAAGWLIVQLYRCCR